MQLRYFTGDGVELSAVEQSLYGTDDVLRQMVRSTIRRFVVSHAESLGSRVLDYGCGKIGTCAIPQPYRALLLGADYVGWDLGDETPQGRFDGVLCTQVLQAVDDPAATVRAFFDWLKPGGVLVLTAPGVWQEIEAEKWRFTSHGLWALAHRAGFEATYQETLCSVVLDRSGVLSVVNGIVARKGKR